MFVATVISTFVALSALAPSVSAMPSRGVGRNVHRSVPSQFQKREYTDDAEILEDYLTYAARYQLLDCPEQHNTTFWDDCCHPLLKDESEDALPQLCWANVTDCDEPTTSVHTSALPTSTHVDKPTSTEKPTSSDKPVTTTSIAKPPPATTSIADPITSAPETTSKPPRTTSAPPATTSAADGGSGGSWRTGGFGTYFYQNGNAGACGDKHSDSDLIVALDQHYYGSLDKASSYCGKKVQIVNTSNGNTVTATIADVCPTCLNDNCLDLSVGTFKALESNLGVGQLDIKYKVLD